MIEELRRREVVAPLSVTRQEARNYYEDHEPLFVESDEYILVEVLVDTEEEARALRHQIDAGMTISALAQEYTQRADAKEGAASCTWATMSDWPCRSFIKPCRKRKGTHCWPRASERWL